MDASATPVLSVVDVNTYYGSIHALRGISLEVGQGEIVALIGGNGAGKSTTLNSISGLVRPRRDRSSSTARTSRAFRRTRSWRKASSRSRKVAGSSLA